MLGIFKEILGNIFDMLRNLLENLMYLHENVQDIFVYFTVSLLNLGEICFEFFRHFHGNLSGL